MPACSSCGREIQGDFAFCPHCGSPLEIAFPAREQRKTVTVLFCDITGSTALGDSIDPEALRAMLARYFERMKAILESHGASVEKFIGDAVMAIFGVPQVHEDDALRACRAAVEMRDALPELDLQARIGVNTGEVVAGIAESLATGDAVNVAARLEQAAQPGEILLGSDTLALVRDAVETEAVEPLELKGKAEAVAAFRLLAVLDAPERIHETVFVGRVRELELLEQAWQRVGGNGRCELVTVVGDAGVGKSRLTAEFLGSIDARVVRGRCLSYGEGITYWPVVEAIKQIDALPSQAPAAASLSSLLGESEEGTSADEIAWAFRKLLEEQAPLVLVFDDIQWGQETFLDLVDHIVLMASAPILVICLARPDLVERRPGWPVSIRLEALPVADADELIPASIAPELRSKIAHAAGGNPLFLTEMAAMAAETGADVLVPPNLQALLAARLDQLESSERSILEHGAVEGEIFHLGSVQALTRDGTVVSRLTALVRKELIRPSRGQLPGDDAFRFRHLLVRDAAYDGLPKAVRAELHERFTAWLESHGEDLVELDEILGYHLEQAALYRTELGRPDPDLAERAGARLAVAGRRALSRGDTRSARGLLHRALELTRTIRLDVQLELDLADAQFSPREAAGMAEAVAERARRAGDETGHSLASIVAANHRLGYSANVSIEELEEAVRTVLPQLEEEENHAALARVWYALGDAANMRGRYEDWTHAREQELHHSRLAGREDPWRGLGGPLVHGPRPADEALRTLEEVSGGGRHPLAVLNRAELLAMLGRFGEAWSKAEEASERLGELAQVPGTDQLAALAMLSGDYKAAADYLRPFCHAIEQRGELATLSTALPVLGRVLCTLGRHDEAAVLADRGRELGDEADVVTQMLWRQVKARVLGRRGQFEEAERLAREAVAIGDGTDVLNYQGDALCDLAEVLAPAGRTDKAAEVLEQALDRYERKKNLAMVAQVKPKLEELRARVP